MKPSIRTYLCDNENHRFFGDGPCQLLHAIEKTGSLRSAALSMNMAYTKALRIIRDAETALGSPLTVRTTGGKGGGGSQLTAEAKDFLTRYETYRNACKEYSIQLYENYFSAQPDNHRNPSSKFSYPDIACIVMASGLGKRFGSNKLMASFHGAPLIRPVLNAVLSVPFFSEILVLTRSQEVDDYCRTLGIPVLLHTLPTRNEALRLGLSHLLENRPDLDGCLFALGDQPLLRPQTLEQMCLRYSRCLKRGAAAPIIQLCSVQMNASSETQRHSVSVGSPVLFDRAYFEELQQLPEKAGGSYVLRRHPEHVQYITAEAPEELMDVDTTDDLKRLESLSADCI